MSKESNVPVLCLSASNIEMLNALDLDRLFLMWAVFSKNKGNLEHGSRFENLSWRFWYHKQRLPDGSNNLSTLISFKNLVYSFDGQNDIPSDAQKSDISQTSHIENFDHHEEEEMNMQNESFSQQQQQNNSQESHGKQNKSSPPPLHNGYLDVVMTCSNPKPAEIVDNGEQNNQKMSDTINNDPNLRCNNNSDQEPMQKTQTEIDQIESDNSLLFSKCKPTRSNSVSLLSDILKNQGITTYFKPSIAIKPLEDDLTSSLKNSVSTIQNQNSSLDKAEAPEFEPAHENYRVW